MHNDFETRRHGVTLLQAKTEAQSPPQLFYGLSFFSPKSIFLPLCSGIQ
jgi:hypothetical protein